MPEPANFALVCVLLLAHIPHCQLQEHFSPDPVAISIVILRAELSLLAGGGGRVELAWVLSSDAAVLSNGSHAIRPSLLVSCPKIYWDEYTLSGPDSYPHSHCGSMFTTALPLPASMVAPGSHFLFLVLDDPPASSRMSCAPSFCEDSVSIHIDAFSHATTADNLLPGGTSRMRAAVPRSSFAAPALTV
jgi:hypothetical protein